jgi:hypothetical protein
MAGARAAHLGVERAGRRAPAAGSLDQGSGTRRRRTSMPRSAHRHRHVNAIVRLGAGARMRTARCIRSNQNGAPNSAVDAVIIQPATCSAKAAFSTGGKLDQPIGSAIRASHGRVERAGRVLDVGGQAGLLPQGAEQVDAVDVEQDRQQQRNQQRDQQLLRL